MKRDHIPLTTSHQDGIPRVLALGRLSKAKPSEEETEMTIESSLDVVKKHLNYIYDGPLKLTQLAEQASGLIADRATIQEAEHLISRGEVDVVIAEDLSRIYRSARLQYAFVEDCVDQDVRVICVADRLDTAEVDWESAMCFASLRHSMPVIDAKRRQSRKNTYAFHQGGNVQKVRYGYRKLSMQEAKSGEFGPVGLRMTKLAECTPVIRKMRTILMTPVDGAYTYAPVLEWLHENEIDTGPYVKGDEWTQRLVKDLLTDPILIGVRRFRVMLFKRIRSTGKFRRYLNPDHPETEEYKEIAHLTDDEFATMQQVIREIAENNPNKKGPDHPLYRRPRKDALFPRQHVTCAVCGGLMYSYDTDQLKCQNAHGRGKDQCWNHVQVNINVARQKFIAWFIKFIQDQPGARELIVDFTATELENLNADSNLELSSVRSRIERLESEAKIIVKAIRKGGRLKALLQESQEIEDQISDLRDSETALLDREQQLPVAISKSGIDEKLNDALLAVSANSFEFARLMRQIIPRFEIVPVQAFDTGLVRPRLRFTVDVERLADSGDGGSESTSIEGELDLFTPPKHFRMMDLCLEVKKQRPKYSLKKIAKEVEARLALLDGDDKTISYMTVKRCFATARDMEAECLKEPHRILTEEPTNASRWKSRNTTSENGA